MGLFDRFKKKQAEPEAAATETAPAPQQGSPWPGRLRGYRDWDDDRKFPVAEALLDDIGQQLENAKVKRKTDEDELDLRGRIDGIPVRIEFEVDMGWVGVEMKCQNGLGSISLEWDPEKVPVEADDDDWADDDELRVFVGKAVFVEGDSDDVNETLGSLSRLPADLAAELIAAMQRQPLTLFFMHPESMSVRFKKDFYEMDDPVAEITAVVQVLAKLTRAVGTGDAAAGAAAAGTATPARLHLVKCTYCSSRFNLGASPRCPNCGAPHDG